jgi:hypothetical protein
MAKRRSLMLLATCDLLHTNKKEAALLIGETRHGLEGRNDNAGKLRLDRCVPVFRCDKVCHR